jgi:hypothetical protein
LVVIGVLISGCAGIASDEEFAEEYKEFDAEELAEAKKEGNPDYAISGKLKYKWQPPSERWVPQNNSEQIKPYNPAIVGLLLKRGPDRFIIVSYGKQEEYGVSEMFELLDQEFAYLAKTGDSGDFVKKEKRETANELFQDKEFFLFDIREEFAPPKIMRDGDKVWFQRSEPEKPTKKNLCVMISHLNKVHFFELYTTVKDYPEDEKDFIKFIESVKGPPKKDAVDLIKEKARQL